MMQFINNSELLLLNTQDFLLSFKFFAYGSLAYLPLIVPFCLLFGILFGYGKLSSEHELTAFANMGYSKPQLAQPAFFLTLLCFFVCSSAIHNWGPEAKSKSKFINALLIEKFAVSALQAGVFLNNFPDIVFYTEELDKTDSKLNKVFLFHSEKKSQSKFIFSDKGRFLNTEDFGGFKLQLEEGHLYSNSENSRSFLAKYKKYIASLFQDKNLDFDSTQPDYLESAKIGTIENTDSFPYLIEYHKRHVISFTCFIFVFLALLFSLKLHSRSSSGKGFLVSLVFSLIFWIALFSAEYLSLANKNIYYMYTPVVLFFFIILGVFYWNKSRSVI